ncbi:MAG: hypothetical protein R3E09_11235 [Novosphingobium sp.]|nr:hypothetical protein [Novosphingobium sp.]
MNESEYPIWPPGLWRRIVLRPNPGWIGAALEDDMHCFHLRIDHADGIVTKVAARGVRTPWTACTGAPDFIAKSLTGEPLSEVANRDPAQQCTHLFDLAILAAAHAQDTQATTFDMRVADRVDGRTTATLEKNGEERLRWQLNETMIEGPDRFAGLDIKRVSKWKHGFPADVAEWSTLLRRAIFISGARIYEPQMDKRAVEMGPGRMGVCFNYQLPQAEESIPIFDRREFSMTPHEPLEGLDPEAVFEAMA